MTTTPPSASIPPDRPFTDLTAYGNGPNDSVADQTENAAITHHELVIEGKTIPYTATAGHLVTVDPSSSRPAAKVFYVAFTAEGSDIPTRPVTFFTMAAQDLRRFMSCWDLS